MTVTTTIATAIDREMVRIRGFEAPRVFVFEARTHPASLFQRLSPGGFARSFQEIELRVGSV